MSLPGEYLDGVVAIGTDGPDDERNWVASGIFMNEISDDGAEYPFLVTNKHVIEGLQTVYVRQNPAADGPAIEVEFTLRDDSGTDYWFPHPDQDVDIAVTPLDLRGVGSDDIASFFYSASESAWDTAELRAHTVSEGDPVYVLGFPMGIVGDERSRVIARGGSIARIQDMLAGAANSFLVDASVYPGNSGGAVVLGSDPTSPGRETGRLIGVVASYVPYRDIAVSAQTGQPRVIFEENSGLARVYPLDYVAEVFASVPEETSGTPAPARAVPPEDVGPSLGPPGNS